jgi:uroporphyrinogen-III decarboxylase
VWDRSELIQNRDVIDSIVRLVALEELEEQGVFDIPRRVVCDRGGEFFISIIDSTPYTATYLLGFQGLMLSFHDNPDNLKYFIERVMRQREPILQGYADAGYDGVYVEEIFSGADLISPQLFEEFVLPGNAEYFRTTRRFGLLTAYYMCGNPLPLIPEIVRLECDAVAFEESKKNLSLEIEEIVDRVGPDKCVFGNIDAPYHGLHASADAVKAEVERQIRAGQRAGGFVVSTGSPLPLETPAERIGMIIAAAHAHTLG